MERQTANAGFTIVELLFVTAIVGTLAAIALPVGSKQIDNARIQRTIVEIRTLEKEITEFHMNAEAYPMSLSAIGRGGLLDPWGNPYEYQNIADSGIPQGQMRKDRFLVPVNSDYDLYSRGKDGETEKPFTAAKARDDIVRASNGQYVGLAEDF